MTNYAGLLTPLRVGMVAALASMSVSGCAPSDVDSPPVQTWTLVRSEANPLISPETPGIVEEWGMANINGPSVIAAPDWLDAPLGKYYMYFAHHRGSHIRMAYADAPEGPWTILSGGVLDLADAPALDHVASPDVLVDNDRRTINMYYHSVDDTTTWKQTTYLATSTDGLLFRSGSTPMGPPYLRAFLAGDQWWAIAKMRGGPGAVLLRANDSSGRHSPGGPDGPFVEGPMFLKGMRHGTVLVRDGWVDIVFSRIGDEPEQLLLATFDPERMWREPYEPKITPLLRSEKDYEGADLPIVPSEVGETVGPVHALRDPYLFVDTDGDVLLFYSVAGENGIGIAEVGVAE